MELSWVSLRSGHVQERGLAPAEPRSTQPELDECVCVCVCVCIKPSLKAAGCKKRRLGWGEVMEIFLKKIIFSQKSAFDF